jgi:hypothetical protein
MTPYKCPACDGYGRRERKPGGRKKRCRACDGSCVVWDTSFTYRPAPHYWHNPYWYNGVVLCGNTTDGTYGIDTSVTAYNGDISTAGTSVTYASTLTGWNVS